MRKLTVRDIDVSGKRVLVRVDFNVPMEKDTGRILDDSRMRAALPTIEYLRGQGARIVIVSHLGRPAGPDEALTLKPIAGRLGELLEVPVKFAEDCRGPAVEALTHQLERGDVLVLENVRFHPGEEANDERFATDLAALGDIYVNDAFGTAHRAHASTEGVARNLPAVAGLLMEKEIEYLGHALANPERPFAAIIGGAKVSSKITVIQNLLDKVDKLLVGGGMANTFLKAEGFDVSESLVEDDFLDEARRIEQESAEKGVKLLLPADVIVAERFEAHSPARRVSVKEVPPGWRIMDIGETTVDVYAHALRDCRMVVWNGPMGVAEMPSFAHGSHRIAAVVASLDATTIVGGGETAAIVDDLGIQEKFSHVSTGGGASLEFLEGKMLPGIAALLDATD